jgi:hypothetical protein
MNLYRVAQECLGLKLKVRNQLKAPIKRLATARLENIFASLVWLFSLARIALPQGLDTTIGSTGLPTDSKSELIRKTFGGGDAGSLLDAALTWSKFTPLNQETQSWIVRIWSPGMPILEVPMIWLEKLGLPIFWSFISSLLLLWTLGFYLLWKHFVPLVGRIPIILISLTLLFSWDFRYLFREGIFYTESFSIIFLLFFLFTISLNVIQENKSCQTRVAIFAGLSLGISTWIRHNVDFYLVLMTATFSIIYILHSRLFAKINNQPSRFTSLANRIDKLISKSESKFLAIAFFTAFVVTLPWRVIALTIYSGTVGAMSSAMRLFGGYIWAPSESEVGAYWESYGSNWACKIDPSTCKEISNAIPGVFSENQLLAKGVWAAITNPIEYLQTRGFYFWKNWIPNFLTEMNLESFIATIFLVLPIFLIWISLFRKVDFLLAFLAGGLFFSIVLQLLIVHFESRYFIPLRLVFASFLIISLSSFKYRETKSIERR